MLHELHSLNARSEFLGALGDQGVRDLALELEPRRCSAGEVLIEAGDTGDRLYLVLHGSLEVLVAGEEGEMLAVREVGPGDIVGEVSLFIGGERSATVHARSDCRLATLSRGGFDRLLEKHPATSRLVSRLVSERLRRSHVAPHLNRIFGPLGLEMLQQLEAEIEWLTLKAGQSLFRQGDLADATYIVESGRLRAAIELPEGGEEILNEMGPGETVGEIALITGGSRAATVYAVRDASLARISSESFARLTERNPRAMLRITRLIIDRFLHQESLGVFVEGSAHTIALVPAEPGVPLADVARGLARHLADYGSVVVVTSADVDRALARTGMAQISFSAAHHIRLSRWLNELEAATRFVVYQADRRWTPWSDRCVRHADHVLIMAAADSDPTPGEAEEGLTRRWRPARAPRRSLVLLRRTGEPRGTSSWLAGREVDQHYHVRLGSDADLARLARSLIGKAVGLVLGGGGARGFAHIGVIKALEELGIAVDLVGGTSMGAIIAGLCAQGLDSAQILRRCRRYAGAQLDFTFPAVSLLAGRKIGAQFRALFGEREIQDLPIPFFAVSTNLTRAEQVVHRSGLLAGAIRASISLPGVLPPAPLEGDLLIDGGLINNVPVDVMHELSGGGPVIAVDVSQAVDLRGDPRMATELSGWKVLWSRLNPLAEKIPVPGILSVLNRVTLVGSSAALRRMKSLADLYLELPLDEWRLLEFEAIEAITDRGYEKAIGPLGAWLAGSEGKSRDDDVSRRPPRPPGA